MTAHQKYREEQLRKEFEDAVLRPLFMKFLETHGVALAPKDVQFTWDDAPQEPAPPDISIASEGATKPINRT